jgi:hypothetical protein
MPSAFPGLCADCAFSRIVDSGRSRFYLCERALTDSGFRKYPPLPVLSCPGYERKEPPATPAIPKPDDKLT